MMLEVKDVTKSYRQPGRGLMRAGGRKPVLAGLDFSVARGEALGLVGESGAGKSTLARLVLGLEKPDRGEIRLAGRPAGDRQNRRRHLSAVFQDYKSSLNPAYNVFEAIAEPLRLAGDSQAPAKVKALMDRLTLPLGLAGRKARELSGGQAQRVCLARALATEPSLIVLDEALSSLDVPAQVSLLNILSDLKKESALAYLFISHDLRSVAWLCDRAVFLKDGRITAQCAVEDLAGQSDAYARHLVAAAAGFQNLTGSCP